MKIALIQPDVTNFEFDRNIARIANCCAKAKAARLCIAPAGAISGPVADCLANSPEWAGYAQELAVRLGQALAGAPALLTALPGLGPVLLDAGLASFPGQSLVFKGMSLSLNVAPEFDAAADLTLQLAPRAYAPGLQNEWEIMLGAQCRQLGRPALSVNLCGGYGNVIYNGQSIALDKDGNVTARALAFAEDVLMLDLDQSPFGRVEPTLPLLAAQWEALRTGVSDFFAKSGATRAVLGLSGGMDSALVACIATSALGPQNVTGLLMPSPYTSRESIEDAENLANNLGISTFTLPITEVFSQFRQLLEPAFAQVSAAPNELTDENLQARLRGVLLMAFANKTGALVLNTGNKSEAAMGYCTLYGDTAGAIAVIGDLFKTQVYELGKWYCDQRGSMIIPERVFLKPPTAELRPDQKDTDSLPPYTQLDLELRQLLQGQGNLDQLAKRVRASAFKRSQSPPPLLVSGLPISLLCQ